MEISNVYWRPGLGETINESLLWVLLELFLIEVGLYGSHVYLRPPRGGNGNWLAIVRWSAGNRLPTYRSSARSFTINNINYNMAKKCENNWKIYLRLFPYTDGKVSSPINHEPPFRQPASLTIAPGRHLLGTPLSSLQHLHKYRRETFFK